MTRKFHTEKHVKKQQRYLIEQASLKPPEKMAEQKLPIEEPPAKPTEAMPSTALPMPPAAPLMAQPFRIEKKKNWFETLKDKFHQLIRHFTS